MNEINVYNIINEKYPSLSKGQKLIANYILNNYEDAFLMTAQKIGEEVKVSESTVVRFAVALGFDGFPEFSKALKKWNNDKKNSVQKMDVKYKKSSENEILNSVIKSDIDKLQDTLKNIDDKAFNNAVEMILSAKKIYVAGLRSCAPLAQFLHFYLNMLRPDVILITSTSTTEIFEQMIRINDKDCFIGISFPRYSMRTLKAMELAHDRNAKIIAITDSDHSPMSLYSNCNLLARSDMVSIVDSLVAPLSIINALVVALCLKKPNEVHKNLEMLENTWDNYQVYLNDEINFIDKQSLTDYNLNKSANKKNKDRE